MTEPPLLASVRVARLISNPPIGINAAYALVRSGAWQSVSIGRRRLVVMASVSAWIEREASKDAGDRP